CAVRGDGDGEPVGACGAEGAVGDGDGGGLCLVELHLADAAGGVGDAGGEGVGRGRAEVRGSGRVVGHGRGGGRVGGAVGAAVGEVLRARVGEVGVAVRVGRLDRDRLGGTRGLRAGAGDDQAGRARG